MGSSWLLFKQFLHNPSRIGAVAPSGRALCVELVNPLDAAKARAIAELGPGTGVVTREVLRQRGENTRFFAVELDKTICEEFRKILPEVKLFNANACELDKICMEENIDELDAVVSGLPWAAFPAELQQAILAAVLKSLKPGGKFTTFAYLQGLILPAGRRFRKLLEENFSQVEVSRVVWSNFPPAMVYRCTK